MGEGQEFRVDQVREPDSDETWVKTASEQATIKRRAFRHFRSLLTSGALPSFARFVCSSDFIFTIKKTVQIPIRPMMAFNAKPKNIEAPPQDLITAFDNLLRQQATLSRALVPGGRSFFDPQTRKGIERSALLMMKGVYTSARPTQLGTLVNVDLANGVFFPEGPFLRAISEQLGKPVPHTFSEWEITSIERKFRGVLLSVTHRGSKKGRYRFSRFARTDADRTEFSTAEGARMSISEYFQNTYVSCCRRK